MGWRVAGWTGSGAVLVALAACGTALHGGPAGATSPQPRSSAAMGYDAKTGQVVLFGGAAERSLGDTWVWQSGDWARVLPTTSPPARENAALAYDPGEGVLVLFGGDSVDAMGSPIRRTDTWTWDGTTWTQRHPLHHPEGGVAPHMATDEARGVALLVTQPPTDQSEEPRVQTWMWRRGDWIAAAPDAAAPLSGVFAAGSGRQGLPDDGEARPIWGGPDFAGSAGMGWDPVSRRVLYVEHVVEADAPVPQGGLVTWSWDGTWHLEHPATAPSASADPLVATDQTGTVLLGGDGTTWHWDGSTWTSLHVPGPPERGAAAIAWDAGARVARVFGGIAAAPGGVYGDTWSWDGASWSRTAGPVAAQPVPQPQPSMPSSGISRDRAVAIARKDYPELGGVSRVENGPLFHFDPNTLGTRTRNTWVWAIVFPNASFPAEGPGPGGLATPIPPARGAVVLLDYQTGRDLGARSPAPDWLMPSQTPD